MEGVQQRVSAGGGVGGWGMGWLGGEEGRGRWGGAEGKVVPGIWVRED